MTDTTADREARLRRTMVEIGRQMQATALVCAAEGNLSVRLGTERMLCTPSMLRKGELSPEDLIITDLAGARISGTREPSSEIRMHVEIYRRRPDVRAVVHAHPITATAFTVAGLGLDIPMMPETVVVLDRIPTAPYGMPGGPELPATLAGIIETHDVVLLDHHGAVACGVDLWDAYNKMETLEKHARIAAEAMRLGGVVPLPGREVQRLAEYRRDVYLPKVRRMADG